MGFGSYTERKINQTLKTPIEMPQTTFPTSVERQRALRAAQGSKLLKNSEIHRFGDPPVRPLSRSSPGHPPGAHFLGDPLTR